MSPLIMYMTSSLGSLWNSLRNSRPRATNAMLSGACHSTVLGRPELLMVVMTCPRLTAFISSIGRASDRAGRTEPGDLLVVEAEPRAQDLRGVLAEERRRRPHAARRLRKLHRRPDHPRLARGGMLAFHQHAAGFDLR